MKIAIIGILVGVIASIAVVVGFYFLVHKNVLHPVETSRAGNSSMDTYKNAKKDAANEKRLYATGQDAEATIVEVHDAGFATKRYTQLELVLDVRSEGGKNFRVQTKKMISQSHVFLFQPGATLKVKYDPAHPGEIALVSSPVPASGEPKKPSQRLEELEELKEKGLISEDEYKKKREKILNSL